VIRFSLLLPVVVTVVVALAPGARADIVVPDGKPDAKAPPAADVPDDNADDEVDAPPLPSHPDVEPVGVPTDEGDVVKAAREQAAQQAAQQQMVDERMKDLPPPSIGLGELIGPLIKTMLMLGVVLLVVYLTLHKGLGKLVEKQQTGKRMRVVERVALDQKRSLFVVEVDGQQILLAAGEGGVVQLKDLGKTPQPAASATSSSAVSTASALGARFAEALRSRPPGAPPPVTTGISDLPVSSSSTDVTDTKKA
jgi:flagellar protein FliO/FliZ